MLREDPGRGEHLRKELVVQVVTVGDEHEGGVFHAPIPHGFCGVEDHLEALARALGVPHHPAAPVPCRGCRLHGGGHGRVNGPVLVVFRDAFNQFAGALAGGFIHHGLIGEHHEVTHNV